MLQKWQKYLIQISFFISMLSGTYFFIMKYLMKSKGEFSVINHPWQNLMLKFHIFFSAVFVFALGSIVIPHIIYKISLPQKTAYKTGIIQIAIVIISIVSGYTLQLISHQSWIVPIAWFHIIISFVLVILFYLHQWIGKQNFQYIVLLMIVVIFFANIVVFVI